LIAGKNKIQAQADSINNYLSKALVDGDASDKLANRRKLLNEQLEKYQKLIGEYQLVVDSKPPVLITVEKAKPSEWPDKPRRMQIMIATGVLSLFFALLAALVIERRKISKQ
jgi:uncharacterized protein involved in exopolysaccharide biosynthesis